MGQLIAFRAVQGLGAGGLIVLAQTVIGDLVSPRERGRYQGLFAAVFTACSVAGPLLGGLITEYASWRWIFYVNLPVGAVAMALISRGLRPRPPGPGPRLDVFGTMLLTAATCCLLMLLSWGGNLYPWSSAPALRLAAAAIVAFALLVLVELRVPQPIFPPHLFRNRVFIVASAVIALTAMALFTAVVFLPLMFQLLMGEGPSRAGLMMAPLMGGVIVASFTGGRIVSRTGRYKMLPVIGLFASTVCFAILAWAARAGIREGPIEGLLVVMGLGIGLVMPNLTTAIQNAVQRDELGSATATAAFFRSLGGALGVALAGALLASHLRTLSVRLQDVGGLAQIARLTSLQLAAVHEAYRAGLAGAFAAGACISALSLGMVLFLPERPLHTAPRGAAPNKSDESA